MGNERNQHPWFSVLSKGPCPRLTGWWQHWTSPIPQVLPLSSTNGRAQQSRACRRAEGNLSDRCGFGKSKFNQWGQAGCSRPPGPSTSRASAGTNTWWLSGYKRDKRFRIISNAISSLSQGRQISGYGGQFQLHRQQKETAPSRI